MLEKTEGTIKRGQSRNTDNTVHTRHRTNTNKAQKHITGVRPGAREGQTVPATYK